MDMQNKNLLLRLHYAPSYLYDEDWEELMETVNCLFGSFVIRLKKQYPELTRDDIKYCCLFKLNYTFVQIAAMMAITERTVSRRKIRLKVRMHLPKECDVIKYIREL